jgi:tRNA-dihydrouridine synthase 2
MTRSPTPEIPRKRPRLEEGTNDEDAVESEMQRIIEHPKRYDKEIDYRNKLVLAPMVRTGSRE